ncbi:MAG TPA: hypothetical protein VK028_05635, partial [Micromonosporaceae bacterium]|nr:hypothetical protein [Micromonosporaceae bacterium]
MRSYLYLGPDGGAALRDLDALRALNVDALVLDLDAAAHPLPGALDHSAPDHPARVAARSEAAGTLPILAEIAPVWVRISPGPAGHEDLRQLAGLGLSGVCLARTTS